jgi:hypothetical protein
MAIDIIQGALYAIGTITGAEWAKSASDGLGCFQDKANAFLTGSSSTMLESGAKGAVKGFEEGGIGGAAKGFYGEGYKNLGETYQVRRAEQIAREAAEGKKDNGEIIDKIDELIAGVYKVDGSITDLGSKAPGSKTKGLSYSQMGYQDVWELVRAGG